MWVLEMNPAKATVYATQFWRYSSIEFYDASKGYVKKKIPTYLQNTKAAKYITKAVFTEYLDATPSHLLELHNELFDHILNDPNVVFNQEHFTQYRKDVKKGVANPRHPEYAAITDDEIRTIEHIFNYGAYISGNTDFSYFLASLMDSNTCTYCNRQYTLTITDTAGKRVIRPEFDHWFAQSLYPDLALSYYNLIPSCSFCNSVLKNDKETEITTHIHPYLDDDPGFDFTYIVNPLGGFDVDIKITATDALLRTRVDNTLRLFKIHEVYGAHSDMELKDLLELASANPGDYIHTLVRHVFSDTGLSVDDIYRLLFGIESDPKKHINRPLSKFKSDILKKIHENILNNGHV